MSSRVKLGLSAAVIAIADYIQRANVAASCARRASRIAVAGDLARYADATPIYVRLAEAEVKLQRLKNGG